MFYLLLTFLIIFNPVLDIGLGPFSDLIVLLSLFLILVWLIFYKSNKIDSFIIDLSILLLIIFVFSSIALVTTDIQYFVEGLRGPLRPIRALITMLGCYLLCRFYLEKYGENKIKDIVPKHIYYAISFHALIMTLQFFIPEFRDAIYSFTTAKNQIEFYQEFRMAGLAGAGGAQISAFQSLGFFIGLHLAFNSKIKFPVFLIAQLLIILSCFFSGRTGLYIIFVGSLAYIPIAFYFQNFRGLKRFMFGSIAVLTLFIGSFSLFYSSNFFDIQFLSVAFQRNFEAFLSFQETGSFQESTISTLFEMIILPSDFETIVFGDYRLWADSGAHGSGLPRILESDIGYIRFLWSYGIFVSILNYIFYIFLAYYVWKSKSHSSLKFLCIFLISMIFILHFKEIFIFTRTGLSIISLISFSAIMRHNVALAK
tara:strand:+ start:1953 stop:3227 length:1275 start_codon:yes stop_codon:yes gene_type:complete